MATPSHNLRMPDERWKALAALAAELGTNREALLNQLGEAAVLAGPSGVRWLLDIREPPAGGSGGSAGEGG